MVSVKIHNSILFIPLGLLYSIFNAISTLCQKVFTPTSIMLLTVSWFRIEFNWSSFYLFCLLHIDV